MLILFFNELVSIFEVSITILYKTERQPKWRQIVKLPDADFCKAVNEASSSPIMNLFKNGIDASNLNFPFHCPIRPGKCYDYNVTSQVSPRNLETQKSLTGGLL